MLLASQNGGPGDRHGDGPQPDWWRAFPGEPDACDGLAIFWDPFRATPFAVVLALIATGMAPKGSKLPLVAIGVSAVAFVIGMTIAVTTNHAVY